MIRHESPAGPVKPVSCYTPSQPLRTHHDRLEALRSFMRAEKLDGFYVPHADEFQNEFLPPSMERLAWLTGFTGSAGEAVVLMDRAAVFVDGRYTTQARDELDPALFDVYHQTRHPLAGWLEEHLRLGARIGFDPRQLTPSVRDRLRRVCESKGAALVGVFENPIDILWVDRPDLSDAPAEPHELSYAGRASASKRAELAARLREREGDAIVFSAPESVAWLLNIRGDDVPYTPVVLANALLYENGTVDLFLDPAKRTPALISHLGEGVNLRLPADFGPALDALAGRRVSIDRSRTSVWIVDRLEKAGVSLIEEPDPCQLPRASKNTVEVEGARSAHVRDGLALTRFLHWLTYSLSTGVTLTERSVSARLDAIRAEDPLFRDLSFPTISATGSHAALPHYRATPESDRTLTPGEVYLVDSGAQYLDGTTDVTRTIAVGEVCSEIRRCYTYVLKGHIAVSRAAFPRGTTGMQLDALARQFLWTEGLDYDHGTGHGVGSYLSVHEGPARISRGGDGGGPLMPGMILSVEPGYYREGAFGIRIENLVCVTVRERENAEVEGDFLTFKTLTLAPYDRNLIETSLLSPSERHWVDAYHARVLETLGEKMEPEQQGWLEEACAPLT